MRRFAVVQHAGHEGPGLIGEILVGSGAAVDVVRVDLGEPLPSLIGLSGVISMGGPMGVHESAAHLWLEPERRWLAAAAADGLAVLGVCLGAQQLAAAMGAEVRAGDGPEIGIGEVALSAAGRADLVLGPAGERLPVVHWHGDTFSVPPGATHLAWSDRYHNQAFRAGELVYGWQFHVEVDGALADAWAPHLPPGVTLDRARLAAVEKSGRAVLGRFTELAMSR
ncbi:MAG: type 1 glutamine amidotransferase [Acidimicrobiales bacterium]